MHAVHVRLADKNKLTIPKFFKLSIINGIFMRITMSCVTQRGLFLKKQAEIEHAIPS